MTLDFGTTQGRLVKPWNGELQCFPQELWRQELDHARSAGLRYVEWLVERQLNPRNPIWTEEGLAAIRAGFLESGLRPYSIIDDFLIDHDLRTDPNALERCLLLISQAGHVGFQLLVVPLFEASDATTSAPEAFLRPILKISERAARSGMRVCLETVVPGREMLDWLDVLADPNISVCFDTGNRAAAGHDICADIRLLGSHISHVHIKDKNAAGANVFLGTGLVDFSAVFRALAEVGYEGAFTFETLRGKDPLRTARFNVSTIEFYLHETVMRHEPAASESPLLHNG